MFKRNMPYFLCLYFLSYLSQSFAYCLLFTYLTSIGYTATERSIMFAIGAMFGMAVQFYIGYLCDKNHTVKKYVYITHIIFAVSVVAIYFYSGKNFIVHLLMVGLMYALFSTTVGLIDSWTLVIDEECNRKFGVIRAMGSIGWSVGSLVAGHLVTEAGYGSLGIAHVISAAALLLLAWRIRDVEGQSNVNITMKDIGKLLKTKGFMLVVAILLFLFMITMSQDYAVVDKFNILGATEKQLSWYWTISAMVELPLFFWGHVLVEKFGLNKLVIFTSIAFGVKYLLFALAGNVSTMLAVSALQMFTFPVLTIISKRLIEQETPDELKVSGQQIGLSMYSGSSTLLAPLVSGLLEDNLGINNALFIITSLSLMALLTSFVYIRFKKSNMPVQ